MTPAEFRQTFLLGIANALKPDAPAGIKEELSEFVSFDRAVLQCHRIGSANLDFLLEAGLPRSAAPFLHFHAHAEHEIRELQRDGAFQGTLFLLGGNAYGDPLGIEMPTQAVVYFNHGRDMQRVFINSSIPQFAETLCLFQSLLADGNRDAFWRRLQAVDDAALAEGAMWPREMTQLAPRS